jgi:hypothetical protein
MKMKTPEQKAQFKITFLERMNADFLPDIDFRAAGPGPELARQTAALEYIAGQLGLIRRFLERDKA